MQVMPRCVGAVKVCYHCICPCDVSCACLAFPAGLGVPAAWRAAVDRPWACMRVCTCVGLFWLILILFDITRTYSPADTTKQDSGEAAPARILGVKPRRYVKVVSRWNVRASLTRFDCPWGGYKGTQFLCCVSRSVCASVFSAVPVLTCGRTRLTFLHYACAYSLTAPIGATPLFF